jgi:hypothetical protein
MVVDMVLDCLTVNTYRLPVNLCVHSSYDSIMIYSLSDDK